MILARAEAGRNTRSVMENNMEGEHSFENSINIKNKLEEAIREKDIELFVQRIQELDRILIGERTTFSLPEAYRKDIELLLFKNDASVKIYLGDGGISRLVIRKESGNIEIFLGAESSSVVKRKWEEI
jgi:hypothetical protein